MTTVAVVGAHGYVGSELCRVLARDPAYELTGVTRANDDEMKGLSFDVLVNAAMPSKRFWAQNHPDQDFVETVRKTADLIYGWRFKKFIQVSTVSARCQPDTVYGRHKAAAEKLCEFGAHLIVRLGPMYSPGLTKGVLIDMLQGRPVFVHGDSRYCFAPLSFAASWIVKNMERLGVVEVGARNSMRLREVADYLGRNIEFEGALDHQEIASPGPDYPDVREVFSFLEERRKEMAGMDPPTQGTPPVQEEESAETFPREARNGRCSIRRGGGMESGR